MSRPSQSELESIDTYLRAHPRGTLPKVEADLAARFRKRAESMQCTTDEVASEGDVPAAVARYLKAGNLPFTGCVWPQLAHLDWKAAGLARAPRKRTIESGHGAFAAIAETDGGARVQPRYAGDRVSAPRPMSPSQPVASSPTWRTPSCSRGPRATAASDQPVPGPSRTADIDQTIVLGVHGPGRVHIVLVAAEVPG